jgi:hypothetical protein
MTGTKKQKMDMSKAIVEAIRSKEPPGRFLKKCSKTGQWNELSKREAADKAAQAMAYAINGESLKEKRRERRMRSRPFPSFQPQNDVGASSSQTADQPDEIQPHAADNHFEGGLSNDAVGIATWERRVGSNTTLSANGLLPGNSNNYQQQLLQLQQQPNSTTDFLITSGINSLNTRDGGSVQALAQMQTLQLQRQRQQEILLHHIMDQHPPASLQELTQLLNEMQQQQEQQFLIYRALTLSQQQQQQQQQLLLQPHPLTYLSAPLPTTLPLSAPTVSAQSSSEQQRVLLSNDERYLTGSQPTTHNMLQNPAQPQSIPSNDANFLSMSMLTNTQNQPNVGTATVPQSQLMDSSLSNSSNNDLHLQQQPRQWKAP